MSKEAEHNHRLLDDLIANPAMIDASLHPDLIDRANLAARVQKAFSRPPEIDSARIWGRIEPGLYEEQERPIADRWLQSIRSLKVSPVHALGAAAAIVAVLFILIQLNPTSNESTTRAHDSLVQIAANSLEDSQLAPAELEGLSTTIDAIYVEANSGLLSPAELPVALAAVRQVSEQISAYVDSDDTVGLQLLASLDELQVLLAGSESEQGDDPGSGLLQGDSGSSGAPSASSGQSPQSTSPEQASIGDAESGTDDIDEPDEDDQRASDEPGDDSLSDADTPDEEDLSDAETPDGDSPDGEQSEQEETSGDLSEEDGDAQSTHPSDDGESGNTDDESGPSSEGSSGSTDSVSPEPEPEPAGETSDPGQEQEPDQSDEEPGQPAESETGSSDEVESQQENTTESENPSSEEDEGSSDTEGEDD